MLKRQRYVFLVLTYSLGLLAPHKLLVAQADSARVLQQIIILGADKTKDWVILRELTFAKGKAYTLKNLEAEIPQSEQNIYNLKLFNEAAIEIQVTNVGLAAIIRVKERWYLIGYPTLRLEERNTYDLVNALLDLNFRRITYGLNAQWRNITGRNETLTFSGKLGFSQSLVVDYHRPGVWGSRSLDFTIGGSIRREKEIILGTERGVVQWRRIDLQPFQRSQEAYVVLNKRWRLYHNFTVRLGYKRFVFADSLRTFFLNGEVAQPIPLSSLEGRLPSLTAAYAYDTRDLRAFPLRGIKAQAFGRLVGPKGLGSTQFAKLGGTWAHHLPLGDKWNFAYGTHHIFSWGDSLPFSEKNFHGRSNGEFNGISTNIRGYEPYMIDGTYINMNKAELKYALVPRQLVELPDMPLAQFRTVPFGCYLSLFVDTGYIIDQNFNNQDQFLKDQWLLGYGAGVNLIGVYDLLLRVEYTRNHLGQGGLYIHTTVPIK
ncbi:MAG: BamA/TamA family outer membrane protein [Bacteroidota bacterium]